MMLTRRQVFRAAGAAGLAAASYRALGGVGPNGRIRCGFIGVGPMGRGRLREFLAQPDAEAVVVCDADETRAAAAAAEVLKRSGRSAGQVKDFRRVLDRQDIDAVVIATPDHWHALPSVLACQAGKDVFVEKPLSYSVAEGRAMVRAALAHKRITQMGNHIHNDLPNYRRVVEIVKSGRLGRVDRVYCWKQAAEKSIGNPSDGTPPPGLDYDLWLGPAPKRPYNPNRSHFNYRYFWDYSGGDFADFWCHISDVAYWALDLQAPASVMATGSRPIADDNGETPSVFEATLEYPGVLMSWSLHPRGFPGLETWNPGCAFLGSEATLVTGYARHEIYVKGKPAPDFPRPDPSIPDSPGHIREFLDGVKSRQRTTCDVEYAHRLNKAGLLANVAHRAGRRIRWDDARETVVRDGEAARLLTRRYRKPWRLST
jgi:predicted dehydrogenase